jgi:hypothetical protein
MALQKSFMKKVLFCLPGLVIKRPSTRVTPKLDNDDDENDNDEVSVLYFSLFLLTLQYNKEVFAP